MDGDMLVRKPIDDMFGANVPAGGMGKKQTLVSSSGDQLPPSSEGTRDPSCNSAKKTEGKKQRWVGSLQAR